jgi:hypothetical protein
VSGVLAVQALLLFAQRLNSESASPMLTQSTALIAGLTALFYVVLFLLNESLLWAVDGTAGLVWIFLPSGVRLVAILLFDRVGALGVVLGSLMVAFRDTLLADPLAVVVAAGISGLAPLVARQVCLSLTNLDVNLKALSALGLVRVAVIFSAFSAALHQAWYVWCGASDQFHTNFLLMFSADVLGSMVVLYGAKGILSLNNRLRGG